MEQRADQLRFSSSAIDPAIIKPFSPMKQKAQNNQRI